MSVLKKNWVHFLIWFAMLVYLVSAPAVHARFFVREGKPISVNREIPAPSADALASADRLDPISLEGQNLYNLWGWAFVRGEGDPPTGERYIVLRSKTRTYFFATEQIERPDVQAHFTDIGQNVLNTGFTSYIAKEVIAQGTYQIGILFEPEFNGDAKFVVTNKEIVKTANQLMLTIPQGP